MSLFAPPNLDSIYVSVLSSATVSSATPAVNRVPVTDGVGGIVYLPYGGGSPDSSFSTLRVANTLSTSSTFTNYLSAGQILASSLIVQSAVVVGANTLTVLGQTFMSSITVTGQFLISTIPGQPAAPLDTAQLSSLKVQTSTLNLVDTTNAGSVLPLYNQAGSLYFNGSAVGSGGSVGSNYAFSNLRVADTLSTSSTFANYTSTSRLSVSTITFNTDITIGSAVASQAPIKIGYRAGNDISYDGNSAPEYIAIGKQAGEHLLGGDTTGVYIGSLAGQYTDFDSGQVAIGFAAGQSYYRNSSAISIGYQAGQISTGGISIGDSAGQTYQGNKAIAIGDGAGRNNQSTNAIAIGLRAGFTAQGVNSIAIGALAGTDGVNTPQHDSTIVLNATGDYFNSAAPQGFYVKPLRQTPDTNILYYSKTTGEITYDVNGGPSLSSNFSFSNLLVAGTLSSFSTLVDFVSAGQVQLSTLNLVDTTNNTSILPLYNQGGSLYFNGSAVGGGGGGPIEAFSLSTLFVADTLSSISTFTDYVSTAHLDVAGITQRLYTDSIYLGSNRNSSYRANSIWYDNTTGQLFVAGLGKFLGTTISKTTDGTSILNPSPNFQSNVNYVSYPYVIYEASNVFYGSNPANPNDQILMASGLVDAANANNFFAVATDGSTLTPPNTQSLLSNIRCATASNLSNLNLLLIGGTAKPNHTSIQYSTDKGNSWFDVTTAQQSETIAIGTTEGRQRMIAVGTVSKKPGSLQVYTSTIQYSDDGLNWTSATSGGFKNGDSSVGGGRAVAFGTLAAGTQDTWVAGGYTPDPADVTYTSTLQFSLDDGLTWSGSVNSPFDQVNGIAFGISRFVAVGVSQTPLSLNTSIAYSTDGSNWTTATSGGFSGGGTAVAYASGINGGTWYAVGVDNTGTSTIIQTSTDGGANWVQDNVFLTAGTGVGYTYDMSMQIPNNYTDVKMYNATTNNITTSTMTVDVMNGIPMPRLFASTLITDALGGAKWEFPGLAFPITPNYSATFTAQYDTNNVPYIVNISEKNNLYVQISTLVVSTFSTVAYGPVTVDGMVMYNF